MRIVLSFLVEQAKTLPLPFLAKEGKTTSVAIFCALVSVPPVQLTVCVHSRYMGFGIPGGAFEVRCDQGRG